MSRIELVYRLLDKLRNEIGPAEFGIVEWDRVYEYPYSSLQYRDEEHVQQGGKERHSEFFFTIETMVYSEEDAITEGDHTLYRLRRMLTDFFDDVRDTSVISLTPTREDSDEELDHPFCRVWIDFEIKVEYGRN